MARAPDWYAQLDASLATLGAAMTLEWLGRAKVGALSGWSERDSIRLLHQFGAVERGNALTLDRASLLPQLEAIAAASGYAAFCRQRQGVARHLAEARTDTAARHFQARAAFPTTSLPRLDRLPATIGWRRPTAGAGRHLAARRGLRFSAKMAPICCPSWLSSRNEQTANFPAYPSFRATARGAAESKAAPQAPVFHTLLPQGIETQ